MDFLLFIKSDFDTIDDVKFSINEPQLLIVPHNVSIRDESFINYYTFLSRHLRSPYSLL
jgi:hypothetical protein